MLMCRTVPVRFVLAAVFSLAVTNTCAEASNVPKIYGDIAAGHGISGETLHAWALAQTGRTNEYRRVVPWPWTVNVDGRRYQFKTRIDMFRWLMQVQEQGKGASRITFGFDNRLLAQQSREELWQETDVTAMLARSAEKLGGKTAPVPAAAMPLMLAGYEGPSGLAGGSGGKYDALIERVAKEVGIDPLLLHTVIRKESAYREKAVSHAGAMGLMQLMPGTAAGLGLKPEQYFDPYANLLGGATYLKRQLQEFGTLELALAAYNAGPGNVRKYGRKIPPFAETRDYVAVITKRYDALRKQGRRMR